MMKRFVLSITLLAMAFAAVAGPVGVERARRVGANWLSLRGYAGTVKLEAVESPFAEIYVFTAADGGFVLVSADDCARPILGYSLTGKFSVEGMPANVRKWLEDYGRDIGKAKDREEGVKAMSAGSSRANDAIAVEWRQLAAGVAPVQPLTTAVSPMLTTTWNQSPLYNDMCPYDSVYGQRVVTGCVATATAQIMKYWNHPATGYGSHSYTAQNSHISYGVLSANFGNTSYAWSTMPNALTSASSQAEIDAVALLMYHVGVALEMGYNVSSQGGSGARNTGVAPSSQTVLVDYFKYAPDLVVVVPGSYDNATYSAMLRTELDQSRPILYAGRDYSGGHSFVCDGYDESGLFHFNWGWGGYCDGYYALGALNPAPGGTGGNATYTFNISNTAILRIRPNTNFGTGGTVTVNTVGGNSACTVTGGGTYSFGDTVIIAATATEGYRFAGWTDNCMDNPRTFTMTGGNYSFTARFETIGVDTMSYCGNMGQMSYWGEYQEGYEKYWGIKLPASSLTPGRTLRAVDFYVGSYYYGGNFDLTIYSGTTAPTDTVYASTLWVDYADCESWYPVYLPVPYTVEAGKSIWITFHNNDLLFPATITASCGNPDGFLYGPSFQPDPEWTNYSFMIRGLFNNPGIVADGDTISYCEDRAYYTGFSADSWGIMIPAADLQGRNYLKSVKVFADFSGLYTLRVYKNGADAPAVLVHTQPADITRYGWHEIMLDNTVAINATDSLWITFTCPGVPWPAASCRYTGNANSNWITRGGNYWYQNGTEFSWLIKAVTSATAPTLPAPTVAISGDYYVSIGSTAMFTAAHTTGTTVNWTIQNGTPATATGDTLYVVWNQTGRQQIVASVSNSNGSGADTLWVSVVDCSQAITEYPYHLGFETYDNMACVDNLDVDNDGSVWRPDMYNAFEGYRAFYSEGWRMGDNVQAIAMDNWLILPKMTTHDLGTTGSYSMEWYDMAQWYNGAQAHYGVYIDTTAGTNTANYVLLAEYNVDYDWYQPRTLDLTPYAGKTFRLAFRHYNNGGLSGLYIDDIYVNENVTLFREGDTISYCGWRQFRGSVGYNNIPTYWGVKFEPSPSLIIDTVKSVRLYVVADGNYTLSVWQGGNDAPGTLLRSMDTTFTSQYGWQEFEFSPVVVDGGQPVWITFVSDGLYPAAYARFCGDLNSDWISYNGTNWAHVTGYNRNASWMIKAVTSVSAQDCDSLSLPYTADFTQCWTATGGATVIDQTHAAITSYGQKIVSPWLQSEAGKTFLVWTIQRDGDVDWSNEEYTIVVESENGLVERWTDGPGSWRNGYYFISPGGRIRISFEYTGNNAVPTFQISDVVVFNYQIEASLDLPGAAAVGDTVTMALSYSLQNGDTVGYIDWYMYDAGWYYHWLSLTESDPDVTVVAVTDSTMSLVWSTPGRYRVNVNVGVRDVYQTYGAYADDYGYINIYNSYFAEDSIYYTSAAKDTVIGCHRELHIANLSTNARVIKDSSFYNCEYLSSVSMPDGLEHIGHRAFGLCYQLHELTIPHGVTFIGDNAFWGCQELTTVNFNADSCLTVSPTTASDGSYWPVFIGCQNVTTINIGENVKRIPDRIFWGCYGLRGTLVIPDSVTYIGYDAFTGWNNNWAGGADTLSIVLGSSVTEIGEYAFGMPYGKMRSVISRNPVPPSIQGNTFYVHQSIATLTVPCGTIPAYMASPNWNDFVLVYDDCNGVDDVDALEMLKIYGVAQGIVVEGADGEQVWVYDVMGRSVATTKCDGGVISVPQAGVYMVVVGARQACKVVVMK